jgi:Tol biopolymer transport system component
MRVRVDSGTQAQQLTLRHDIPAISLYPSIAPRGNRLAYTAELVNVQIWQVRPGEAPRNFGLSSGMDVTPQYSPDGKRIVFASDRSGFHQIWISDSDGGNPNQLTHFDEGDSGTPRWSPDGRSIVFDHWLKDGWRIYVMSADGTHIRRVTPENFFEAIPSWSGNGKWIYYTSDRTGRFEIWKAPAQGGKGVQITQHGGYTVFECPVRKSLFYTKPQTPGIWSLDLETGEEQLVLPSGGGEREFAVMPDGIYYLTPPRPDGIRSVRFHRFATGKEEEIASINVETFEGLAVSPDRHAILFTAAVQFASNVMVVDNFR